MGQFGWPLGWVVHAESNTHRRRGLEEIRDTGRLRFGHLSERRQVVEYPESAPVCSCQQIGAQAGAVVLDLYFAHRNRRHVQPQRMPIAAIIERNPHLGLGSGIEESLLPRIFPDGISDRPRCYAIIDLHPGSTTIVRTPEVRIHVVNAHGVCGCVRGVSVIVTRFHVEDTGPRLDSGRGHVGPIGSAVHRHLNVSIISTSPNHVHVDR